MSCSCCDVRWLLVVAGWLLMVVRCVLSVVCCLSCVARRCSLLCVDGCAVCRVLFIVRCVVRCAWLVGRCWVLRVGCCLIVHVVC